MCDTSAIQKSRALTHTTTWMNLGNIMPNARSNTQKAACCMIPSTQNVYNMQIRRPRKWISSFQGQKGGGGEGFLRGVGFLLEDDKKKYWIR